MQVASDQAFPRIVQLSFFLPNRVGALQRVVEVLENDDIEICAVSILDAHDHAVIRMIVDKPDQAGEILKRTGHEAVSTSMLGVALPVEVPGDDQRKVGIGSVLGTLLRAELNVLYSYALITLYRGDPVLAILVDDRETATQTLRRAGLELVDQRDLQSD